MRIYSLFDIEKTTKNPLTGSEQFVVFVGSGISIWAPTNLPTGQQFTKSVFNILFNQNSEVGLGKTKHIVRQYFDSLPFEVINDRCPDATGIESILKKLYDRYDPNPVHQLLAELLCKGQISSIVTPNYDCCLDTAIANAQHVSHVRDSEHIARVVNSNDVPTETDDGPIYFKIHGSTDDSSGTSLIFRLNQEGMLDPWKRELFRKILHNKTLLIIGYSGSDFDICPEIALAQPRKIIWNFLSWNEQSIPPNIKFLSERCAVDVIVGDMLDLLTYTYRPVMATPGKSDIDLEGILAKTFDEDCKRLWRLRLLNSINFNRLTLDDMKEPPKHILDPWSQIFFLSEYAAALASSGKYRHAAKLHDQGARIAEVELRDEQAFVSQMLIACDTWRCYGSFLRSILRYRRAARLMQNMQSPDKSPYADLDRNLILLIRHPYDLFQRMRLHHLEKKMQEMAADAISRSSLYYRESGNWYGLQQLGLWEERFHLREAKVVRLQEYETPLSNEGYRQLNFPMGRMMSYRNGLRGISRLLKKAEIDEIHKLIAEANELGIMPEVWKLYLLILRKAHKQDRSLDDFFGFARAFTSCQYTLLFGIWRLVIGE